MTPRSGFDDLLKSSRLILKEDGVCRKGSKWHRGSWGGDQDEGWSTERILAILNLRKVL